MVQPPFAPDVLVVVLTAEIPLQDIGKISWEELKLHYRQATAKSLLILLVLVRFEKNYFCRTDLQYKLQPYGRPRRCYLRYSAF